MEESAPPESPPPSQEFLVNAFCERCGYDLRSNNISGPCPHCGLELPYAKFVSGLANANPIWLDRILMGITGILIAECILIFDRGGQLLSFGGHLRLASSYLWTRVYEVRFGVLWFSAIFLLAAKEIPDEKESWTSPRKLLIWLGSAYAIIRLIRPMFTYIEYDAGRMVSIFLDSASMISETGATVVMFLYILRIGQRDGDPFLKRHLPLVVTLVIVSIALSILLTAREAPLSPTNAFSLSALMQAVVAGYAVYVLLKMRRSIAGVLADAHR